MTTEQLGDSSLGAEAQLKKLEKIAEQYKSCRDKIVAASVGDPIVKFLLAQLERAGCKVEPKHLVSYYCHNLYL